MLSLSGLNPAGLRGAGRNPKLDVCIPAVPCGTLDLLRLAWHGLGAPQAVGAVPLTPPRRVHPNGSPRYDLLRLAWHGSGAPQAVGQKRQKTFHRRMTPESCRNGVSSPLRRP